MSGGRRPRIGIPWPAASGYDPNAQAYITAVETADGQVLETEVKDAINALVIGIKADGDWDDIHTLMVLNDARTLAGMVVALKGNNAGSLTNIVSSDLVRGMGIAGNGTNKYFSSNVLMDSYGSTTAGWMGSDITTWNGTTIGPGQIPIGIPASSGGATRHGLGGSAAPSSSNTIMFGRMRTSNTGSNPEIGSPGFGLRVPQATIRISGTQIVVKSYNPAKVQSTTHTLTYAAPASASHVILSNFDSVANNSYVNGSLASYVMGNGVLANADRVMGRLITFTDTLRTFFGV